MKHFCILLLAVTIAIVAMGYIPSVSADAKASGVEIGVGGQLDVAMQSLRHHAKRHSGKPRSLVQRSVNRELPVINREDALVVVLQLVQKLKSEADANAALGKKDDA